MKGVTSQLITTCVEGILVVRGTYPALLPNHFFTEWIILPVHALYNCGSRTGVFLSTILAIGTALEVAGTTMTLAYLGPGIGGSICVPTRCPTATLVVYACVVPISQIDVQLIGFLPSCGTGLIQITLLVMTLFRILFYRHTGWMRTPVVSLVLRDGVLVFLMLASPSLPKYPPQFRWVDRLCIFIYSCDSRHHRVRD